MNNLIWTHFLILIPVISSASAFSICSLTDQSFQLVTGYVYQHPQHVLETKPGMLELSDCLYLCLNLPTCKAINYETGLCVAFNSSSVDYPAALSVSEFPVFTMYAEKICLPTISSTPCNKAWAVEMVPDAELEGFEEKRVTVRDVAECRTRCRDQELFLCRSANYFPSTGLCSLSTINRHSSPSSSMFHHSPGTIYLESTCVEDPAGLCDFKPVRGRILKTVDSVFRHIGTAAKCQELCLTTKHYRCYSYDYGEAGEGVCRLSHHTAATLTHVTQPWLQMETATMHEVTACYNVSVACTADGMVAHVRTSKMFSGKIYTKSRPHSCIVDVKNKLEFELNVEYNNVNCDVDRDVEGQFKTDIILQHHDRIVTSSDIGLQVRCNYMMANTTVHQGMKMEEEMRNKASAEDQLVGAPNVSMRITDQIGGDISTARVGDPLALRFEILDKRSPYEIFVRELVAMDGIDSSEILLIDSRGCPTDSSIMQSLVTVGSAKVLQANFDAFKFPTSQLVQFRALVTPCMPRCDPVRCEDTQGTFFSSFGRRKRDVPEDVLVVTNSPENKRMLGNIPGNSSVVVANAVHIIDKFHPVAEDDSLPDTHDLSSCMFSTGHTLTVCMVLSVFLVCQCVLLMMCVRTRTHRGDTLTLEHPYFHTAMFNLNKESVDKVTT